MFSDTLFGHTRGAYTGADSERRGLVEKASDGILFLDEIGDLETGSQVKLLRLLEEREYYPLGTDQIHMSSARVLAATNAHLKRKQVEGVFRKDLYFRLMVHHIHIPPLRERFEDLPLLVDHFLGQAVEALKKNKPSIDKRLFALLESYPFPGNVRELQSMIFDAMGRQKGPVLSLAPVREYISSLLGAVPEDSAAGSSAYSRISYSGVFPTLEEVEEFFISEALEKSKGNQSLAARLLGVNQSTLSRRLKTKKGTQE